MLGPPFLHLCRRGPANLPLCLKEGAALNHLRLPPADAPGDLGSVNQTACESAALETSPWAGEERNLPLGSIWDGEWMDRRTDRQTDGYTREAGWQTDGQAEVIHRQIHHFSICTRDCKGHGDLLCVVQGAAPTFLHT